MTEKLKVVLSDKAYLKPPKELIERFQNNLVYEGKASFKNAPTKYVHNYGPVMRGTYWIPVERLDMLQDYDYEVVDKRARIPVKFPEPSFTLRDDQQEVLDKIDDTALVNAAPGWGKSITALAIAKKLGQKTLIVCTTTTIRDMWIKEIKKFFGFTPGMVGSGKSDTSQIFTVGNIQTLTKKSKEYSNLFGTVILDECHHSPASTFTKLLLTNKARYKIGLSGTLYRKDGLHAAFKDFFGFNVLQPMINNVMQPTIHRYNSGATFPGNSLMPWADRVTSLTKNIVYRKEVLALASLYIQLGHKVILVSDRIEFLEYINEEIDAESRLFVGNTELEEREEILQEMTDNKIDMLCASQNIFSEGVSQNNLSCMILGTPISDNRSLLNQLAGRVMRKHPDKLKPIIVDMVLKGESARAQANKRKSIFKMFGWPLVDIDLQELASRVIHLRGRIDN